MATPTSWWQGYLQRASEINFCTISALADANVVNSLACVASRWKRTDFGMTPELIPGWGSSKVTVDFVVTKTRPAYAWDGIYPVLSTASGGQENLNRTQHTPFEKLISGHCLYYCGTHTQEGVKMQALWQLATHHHGHIAGSAVELTYIAWIL